jgi:hypothetical protein
MAFIDHIEEIGFFRLLQKRSLVKDKISSDVKELEPVRDTIKQSDFIFDKTLTPIQQKYEYEFKIPQSAAIVNTPVYVVVNKFCEVLNTSSHQNYGILNQPKTPHYYFFLSQQDAIDFIYKIAQTRPKYFKRMGLGINSIPLDQYLKKYRPNNFTSLITSTEEFETFIKKRNLASDNIYKSSSSNPDFDFDRNKSLLMAYRIKDVPKRFKKSQPEFEPTKIYLKLADAMKDERVQKGLPVIIEVGRISETDLHFQIV